MKTTSNLEVDNIVVDDFNTPIESVEDKRLSSSNDIFRDLIGICNTEHLSYCDCKRSLIEAKFNELMKVEIEDLKYKNLDNNREVFNERYDYAMSRAVKLVGDQCERDRVVCSIEKAKIEQTVSYFDEKYDLKDPRVFVIVDALLHQMLSAHRMQLHSNSKGILNTWYDKEGNKRYALNPVEDIKLRYDEAKINAIAALDKIMEGNKIKLTSNLKIADINDVFSKIVDVKEGEYREL